MERDHTQRAEEGDKRSAREELVSNAQLTSRTITTVMTRTCHVIDNNAKVLNAKWDKIGKCDARQGRELSKMTVCNVSRFGRGGGGPLLNSGFRPVNWLSS